MRTRRLTSDLEHLRVAHSQLSCIIQGMMRVALLLTTICMVSGESAPTIVRPNAGVVFKPIKSKPAGTEFVDVVFVIPKSEFEINVTLINAAALPPESGFRDPFYKINADLVRFNYTLWEYVKRLSLLVKMQEYRKPREILGGIALAGVVVNRVSIELMRQRMYLSERKIVQVARDTEGLVAVVKHGVDAIKRLKIGLGKVEVLTLQLERQQTSLLSMIRNVRSFAIIVAEYMIQTRTEMSDTVRKFEGVIEGLQYILQTKRLSIALITPEEMREKLRLVVKQFASKGIDLKLPDIMGIYEHSDVYVTNAKGDYLIHVRVALTHFQAVQMYRVINYGVPVNNYEISGPRTKIANLPYAIAVNVKTRAFRELTIDDVNECLLSRHCAQLNMISVYDDKNCIMQIYNNHGSPQCKLVVDRTPVIETMYSVGPNYIVNANTPHWKKKCRNDTEWQPYKGYLFGIMSPECYCRYRFRDTQTGYVLKNCEKNTTVYHPINLLFLKRLHPHSRFKVDLSRLMEKPEHAIITNVTLDDKILDQDVTEMEEVIGKLKHKPLIDIAPMHKSTVNLLLITVVMGVIVVVGGVACVKCVVWPAILAKYGNVKAETFDLDNRDMCHAYIEQVHDFMTREGIMFICFGILVAAMFCFALRKRIKMAMDACLSRCVACCKTDPNNMSDAQVDAAVNNYLGLYPRPPPSGNYPNAPHSSEHHVTAFAPE